MLAAWPMQLCCGGRPPVTRHLHAHLQAYGEFPNTYRDAFETQPAKLPTDFTPSYKSLKVMAECPQQSESLRKALFSTSNTWRSWLQQDALGRHQHCQFRCSQCSGPC